ncbi:Polyketide synthase [Paramyrothecium foliicola]|nr:Polyketide synthase [Paramyrothecium foliicola]
MMNGNGDAGHGPQYSDSNGLATPGAQSGTPLAICGMALRLPGGLATPRELWDFLLTKGDARTQVPESRYQASSFYSDKPKPATVATQYGYFLNESVDIGALDTTFFSMSRTEVERADPQQRLMLEIAREAFEDAGITDWRGKTIGCYVGSFGEDWLDLNAKETQPWGMFRVTGQGDFMLSNRISYEMDLRGPSVTVRTACSSSLTCLSEACMAVSRGACEAALVGGVNLMLSPTMTTAMTEQGVLSKDGSCKTFSADADGYARGEGVTAIIIKPLADALRDGNPVRAIIRAACHNFDGKTPGVSVPSSEAQEALIRRTYKLAGLDDFGATAMVECHGTGTPTGDPIEANAVARVFGDPKHSIYIGSVKPNLGHSEGASGLVSIIKSVLALENRTIPPNIKFSAPNPKIPFDSAGLVVPLEATPWPQGKLERVSVNSFGIGGANAHAVLDSASSFLPPIVENHQVEPPAITPQLMLFSGNTAKSAETVGANYRVWLEKNQDKAADLSYTLARRRVHLPWRSFAIFHNGVLSMASPPTNSSHKHRIVMVFTGQGAQWPCMGKELLLSQPAFKASIEYLDEQLQQVQKDIPSHEGDDGVASKYSIIEELLAPGKKSRVGTARLSQPLCTALQIALVDTFQSLGVRPTAVVGHSSGEIAAAYAAGALTAREAIIAAHHRGAVTQLQKREGAMAAIGMSWEETSKFVDEVPHVTIACDNSPESVTISGDAAAVKKVVADIQEAKAGVLARLLQVDKAYHSHHMAEIGDRYLALIGQTVCGRAPQDGVAFFSSVTGEHLTTSSDRRLDSAYWRENLESPVRFRKAITSIVNHELIGKKDALFLEIGPHGALAGPLRQTLTGESVSAPYISALTRSKHSVESVMSALGKLHCLQVPVDLEAFMPRGKCLSDLPTYPWNHEATYWAESRLSRDWRLRQHPHHDLLGSKATESTDIEPIWRNLLHLDHIPWLRDHKVGEDIVFPFAGYIALAGEAVRQLTGGKEEGFKIRNIIVSVALVLSEENPTEIVTTFHRRRLTNTNSSHWWEFTVASHNGHAWNKHCAGEVMAVDTSLPVREFPKPQLQSLPRKIKPVAWYGTLSRGGLDLGPEFQRIREIATSTNRDQRAVGTISNSGTPDESSYHIHPTVIDGTLQLMSVAAVSGCARKVKNWLPVSIDEISVARWHQDMTSLVSANITSNLALLGQGQCVTEDGSLILEAKGIQMALADGSQIPIGVGTTHAAARITWSSHIDFLNVQDLILPKLDRVAQISILYELAELCLLAWQNHLNTTGKERVANSDHIQKYVHWMSAEVQRQGFRRLPAVRAGESLESTIASKISELTKCLEDTPLAPAAISLQQLCDRMPLVWNLGAQENLMPADTLHNLHRFVDESVDQSQFLRQLGHWKPNLRILELGTAGQESSAKEILKHLTLPGDVILCSKYTFTSTGFVSAKDQQQVNFGNMEYATLEINKDLSEQGFEPGQYDLIVASNHIHKTPCLKKSLANIKKLLSSDGRLLLRELCPASKWINMIYGLQQSWWCGAEDGRSEEPYVDPQQWVAELLAAGFDQVDKFVLDAPQPLQLTATIIAQQSRCPEEQPRPKSVTFLCKQAEALPGDVCQMIAQFEKAGYEVVKCGLEDSPPPGQDVISLLDEHGPFFENLDSSTFELMKHFVCKLDQCGMLWVTGPCQVKCHDPRYAPIVGFARTMRSEMLIDLATCEVSSLGDDSRRSAVLRVFEKFASRSKQEENNTLDPDFEYIVDENGTINVGRLYPFALSEQLLTAEDGDRAVVDVGTSGRINTLGWFRQPHEEMSSVEVAVEVHSAGLNFRDILVALGIVELPARQFGLEAAGIVTKVGAAVKDFQVGDRVFSLKKQAFATHIVAPEFSCAKIPDGLSFDEAATMLVPYLTAIYSLIDIGRLTEGQSVLIHSACGGVGLAAIQVAQMLNANVYATVGNEEKVQYLMNNFNLPRNKILHSRNDSFVDDLRCETQGRGVDVVLNSLSGELLHATWNCVAEFGTMVEIGKRDLIGGGKLDMKPFLANRSYSCVDIDQLWKRPSVLKRLITSILEKYEAGQLRPIRPIKVFTASKIQDAFRYMQKGQHVGRIGLSLKPSMKKYEVDDSTLPNDFEATKRPRRLSFQDKASYLLVGGLGGLGRAIAPWMADHGAKELIFLSRSAGMHPEDEDLVNELSSIGCRAHLVKGDVTRLEDVQTAFRSATHPVKGVLQMTMVLRDQNFEKMTFREWSQAAAPKVQGTWNLHNASVAAGHELDFFVCFSSLSGVIGQPGQANYASANTFLDSMVQYRRSIGQAASVIDIGAVEEIGYISNSPGLINKMKSTGFKGVTEQELLDALTVALTSRDDFKYTSKTADDAGNSISTDAGSFILGLGSSLPLDDPANRAIWRKDRRMAVYHNLSTGSGGTEAGASVNEAVKTFVATAMSDTTLLKAPESATLLAVEIGKKLFDLLLKPHEDLHTTWPLVDLGLDSLVAIELRAWWKQMFKFDISVLEMLGMGSLEALGQHAINGLLRLTTEGKE